MQSQNRWFHNLSVVPQKNNEFICAVAIFIDIDSLQMIYASTLFPAQSKKYKYISTVEINRRFHQCVCVCVV